MLHYSSFLFLQDIAGLEKKIESHFSSLPEEIERHIAAKVPKMVDQAPRICTIERKMQALSTNMRNMRKIPRKMKKYFKNGNVPNRLKDVEKSVDVLSNDVKTLNVSIPSKIQNTEKRMSLVEKTVGEISETLKSHAFNLQSKGNNVNN